MPSIYPVVFGYNYTNEQIKAAGGGTKSISSEDARLSNIVKILSYIPIINNIGAIVLLVGAGRKIIDNEHYTKLEKCALISRLVITATGLGVVFLPVDLIATLVKAVQYYRQQHTVPAV